MEFFGAIYQFCENKETILKLWAGHYIILKLKPEIKEMVYNDDKAPKEPACFG